MILNLQLGNTRGKESEQEFQEARRWCCEGREIDPMDIWRLPKTSPTSVTGGGELLEEDDWGVSEADEANCRRRECDEEGSATDENWSDHSSFLGLCWLHSPHGSQEGKWNFCCCSISILNRAIPCQATSLWTGSYVAPTSQWTSSTCPSLPSSLPSPASSSLAPSSTELRP